MAKINCKKWISTLIIGIIFATIAGVMYPVEDYIVKKEVKKRVIISNKSELYDIWKDIPIPVYMQFYMFDIGNTEEFLNGEKPFLSQRGPYTYRERRNKFDIVWNHNGTVSYRQNRTFEFVPEMSTGEESDTITTINPLIATIAQGLRFFPDSWKFFLSLLVEPFENKGLLTTRSVEELIFGYGDPVLTKLNKVLPGWFDTYTIGYFIRKNFTDDGLYTVYTGEENIDLLGVIDRYNGQSHVDIWTTKYANMVNGSDGTLGPPFRFNDKQSPIFVSDLCRSIYGIFVKEVETPQGIPLRRFGQDIKEVENATENPDNLGFCTPQTNCLPQGLMNSTLCQEPVDSFPIPIIFSFPHFLYASPDIQASVEGLNPNVEEHQTVVDTEPWTGLVMQVAKRLQINIFVEQVKGFRQTENIQTTFFPVLWLNESSVINDKYAAKLKRELFTPLEVMKYTKIVLFAIGGLLVAVSVAMLIRIRCKQNTNTSQSHKDADDDPLLADHEQNNSNNRNSPLTYDLPPEDDTPMQRRSRRMYDDPVTSPFAPRLRESGGSLGDIQAQLDNPGGLAGNTGLLSRSTDELCRHEPSLNTR